MAAHWRVYSPAGKYLGSLVYAEDAAALVALQGPGATIRNGPRIADILWTEGEEECPAGESYDTVVNTVMVREARKNTARLRAQASPEDPDRALSPEHRRAIERAEGRRD